MPSDVIDRLGSGHIKASYIQYKSGIKLEKGFKSEIMALTFKDNPDAARGKDAEEVFFAAVMHPKTCLYLFMQADQPVIGCFPRSSKGMQTKKQLIKNNRHAEIVPAYFFLYLIFCIMLGRTVLRSGYRCFVFCLSVFNDFYRIKVNY